MIKSFNDLLMLLYAYASVAGTVLIVAGFVVFIFLPICFVLLAPLFMM